MSRTEPLVGRSAIPIMAMVLFMSLFVIPGDPAMAQEYYEWSSQNSFVEDWQFNDVSALDASHVWAVGERGGIGFFDGNKWSSQRSGTTETMYGVSALDASHVWAVGEGGTILFFNGIFWSPQESGITGTVFGVSALDASHVWAVSAHFDGFAIPQYGRGCILFFDGISWTTQERDMEKGLLGVSALDASHVWAVGEEGAVLSYDGTSWSARDPGSASRLFGVSALDKSHVWAVGTEGTILFFDGTSWSPQESGTTYHLYGVAALDASHVWAVGGGGTILFYDGTSWSPQGSGLLLTPKSVSALDARHVWAVGDAGICVFNGNDWKKLPGGIAVGPLYGISALDASHVWAVGGQVSIFKGSSALYFNGTSWSEAHSTWAIEMRSVSALDNGHVWAVGGRTFFSFFYTQILFFDGASWSTQDSGTTVGLNGVSALDASHVWAVGGGGTILFYDGTSWSPQTSGTTSVLRGVSALDASHVWAVGEGGTVLFFDGTSWSPQASGITHILNSVSALDASHVWAVGEGGAVLFYDGTSWSPQTSGTTSVLRGVSALDKEHVWAVGGTILFFDGTSWSPQMGTAYLFAVSALDTTHVWAVGSSTTILFGHPASPPTPSFSVSASAYRGGGKAIPALQQVAPGGTAAIDIVPDPGCSIIEVVDNGTLKGAVSHYEIEDIASNHNVVAVFKMAAAWYFAEGYTGAGFQEYLCLGQPADAPLDVAVTYLFRDGTTQVETYAVPALSRLTVDVNEEVGADKEVSIVCEASTSFIAERPMYFNYQGDWDGGHDAVGATSTAETWYFAEGYTGAGFDEWICVLNPGDETADLTFRFQTEEEGEKVIEGNSVPAHSRASFKANDLLGGGSYQTSLALESTRPVVAERPMYFSYQGKGAWNWTGGHCVMGVPELAKEYFFAEGCTRSGFEEWLTLQNPNGEPIKVDAVFLLANMGPVGRSYTIEAGKRFTVYVPDEVGLDKDVSIHLTCPIPFLAERPMYFNYQGTGAWNWTGGHCVIGSTASSREWLLAEGYTGAGFEEWLCFQNAGFEDAVVTITYFPEGGAAPITRSHTVPDHSRYTVLVNEDAGAGLSIFTQVTSEQPVIVERPMYFDYSGWTGGHDVVGFAP